MARDGHNQNQNKQSCTKMCYSRSSTRRTQTRSTNFFSQFRDSLKQQFSKMKLHRTPTKIVSLLPHWPSHCLSSTKVFYLVPSVQQTELHLKKKLTVRHTRAECVCECVHASAMFSPPRPYFPHPLSLSPPTHTSRF